MEDLTEIISDLTLSEDSDELLKDLGNDWIPECVPEKKPVLNQKFADKETAFKFYHDYGKMCAFDVRKSSEKKKLGKTTRKYFLCSRSGSNEYEKEYDTDIKRRRRTVSAKCDCPAKLIIGRSDDGEGFVVRKFIEKHNHSFPGKGAMQFLRCSRSLNEFHKKFILDAAKLNIGATRAYAIFKSMIGSYENVGATVIDFKNFSRDIKNYIGKHDADLLIQKFKDIQNFSDTAFRFEFKVDAKNHLTRLIWADGVGRRNFEVFGDVVSFDATYRTNKYGMVFIPLIGIDNHWKSVTFGAALLEKEDTENYKWLCESFKIIFGSDLKCIITDQDPAMKIAINDCFPTVKHRLCMWHIMKKFPAKIGSLFCSESAFMDKLKNFVWSEHVSPSEFETGWKQILEEFSLTENNWLKEIYDLRASWIPAFFNDEPMVGLLRTTSRSESSNFYFNHFVQKGDTLSEFYICYQSAIEKQRNANGLLNHKDSVLPRTMNLKRIEKDVAELYTRSIFYKIQEEISASSGDMEIQDIMISENIKLIKLKDPLYKNRTFEVKLNMQTSDVDCTCKLFTRVGYLCSHSFVSLGISGIHIIPRQYINNRWLKNAEERFSTIELGNLAGLTAEEEVKRAKTRECWFEFQACLSDASGNALQIDIIHKDLINLRKYLKDSSEFCNSSTGDNNIDEYIGSRRVEEITILPPNQSNNKGCRKRIIGSAEKSIAGNKRVKRTCKTCHELAFHDSRNCPSKL